MTKKKIAIAIAAAALAGTCAIGGPAQAGGDRKGPTGPGPGD